MSESQPRLPRAFFFFDNGKLFDNYIDKCKVEKISPGFGDILCTEQSTYIANARGLTIIFGYLNRLDHHTDSSLEQYWDVINTCVKYCWKFKIMVRASDPMLCDLIGEEVMSYWDKARVSTKEYGYKVKIWFSREHHHWCHSRKFFHSHNGDNTEGVDFMTTFRMCLGEWKSLMIITADHARLTVKGRSPRCVQKFGKVFAMPEQTLKYNDYMWAFIWFLPTKIIDRLLQMCETRKAIVYKYISSSDAYVMLEDKNDLKLSFSSYDYRFQRTREKFFHETVVNIYMALAPFQIAVYEYVEIINRMPYMEYATQPFVVRILESLHKSTMKIYKQREKKRKQIKSEK